MWARVAELAIGIWLLASPWVLSGTPSEEATSTHRLLCGGAIVALSLASFWRPLRKAHLVEIPVALWILGVVYLTATHPAAAVVQSDILAALFLLNFAIIPSPANVPPGSWQKNRLSGTA